MSGFDSGWLDLREPADHAARDPALLEAAARWAALRPDRPIVDLGAGTGSTLRAFGARAVTARWILVDDDPALLAIAVARGGAQTTACRADLRDLAALPLDGAGLATASALFDLAGEAWAGALVDRLAARRVGLYAALNYDGRMHWSVPHGDDAAILGAFNTHQRRDKGLGPALGPAATGVLAQRCAEAGYAVARAQSDWVLGPVDAALQGALLAGIAAAAAEAGIAPARVDAWRAAREEAIATGRCVIGHEDLLARPAGQA